MDDLRTKLTNLDQKRQAYVLARSKSSSKAEAYRESGVSKGTVNSWPDKDELEDLAAALRVDRVLLADKELNDAVEPAVKKLVTLLNAQSEMVQFQAAKLIMERVMGQVAAKVDVTSAGEKISSAPVEDMMALFQTLDKREQQKRQADDEPANIISE